LNNNDTRIYLIGFMGCGKTTIGKKLAKRLHYTFVDLDEEIEKTVKTTIPDIFKNQGEEEFRRLESILLKQFAACKNFVMATGGGTPCYGENIDVMNGNGISIYIKLPAISLIQRIKKSKKNRPLIFGKNDDELEFFVKQALLKREAFYCKATYVVEGLRTDPEKIAELLSIR